MVPGKLTARWQRLARVKMKHFPPVSSSHSKAARTHLSLGERCSNDPYGLRLGAHALGRIPPRCPGAVQLLAASCNSKTQHIFSPPPYIRVGSVYPAAGPAY